MRHILVDMDGVLCDFQSAALALWDFDPAKYPPNQWDIPEVLGISVSDFWGAIDREPSFWRNLKPYPWTPELIKYLEEKNVPWTISTSPARNPQCSAQKVEWMQKHIHPHFTNYMIGPQKHLFAGPGRLLIDDNDKNCSLFVANGGSAVLFPQRWNSQHHVSDGYAFVRAAIEQELWGDP